MLVYTLYMYMHVHVHVVYILIILLHLQSFHLVSLLPQLFLHLPLSRHQGVLLSLHDVFLPGLPLHLHPLSHLSHFTRVPTLHLFQLLAVSYLEFLTKPKTNTNIFLSYGNNGNECGYTCTYVHHITHLKLLQ